MLSDFKSGDQVKINPFVYKYKWDGWDILFETFGHHVCYVDRVIDNSDIKGADSFVVIGFPYRQYNKTMVKPSYLEKLS